MTHQWSTTTRYTILTLILVLVAAFVYVVRPLISPLIIASLHAYILYPLVKRMEVLTRTRYAVSVARTVSPVIAV
jgi:predicted PurR-regulated permease PerM